MSCDQLDTYLFCRRYFFADFFLIKFKSVLLDLVLIRCCKSVKSPSVGFFVQKVESYVAIERTALRFVPFAGMAVSEHKYARLI